MFVVTALELLAHFFLANDWFEGIRCRKIYIRQELLNFNFDRITTFQHKLERNPNGIPIARYCHNTAQITTWVRNEYTQTQKTFNENKIFGGICAYRLRNIWVLT